MKDNQHEWDEDELDAYFIAMATLIANRHDSPIKFDVENRICYFDSGNVDLQLDEDLMTLFGAYCI